MQTQLSIVNETASCVKVLITGPLDVAGADVVGPDFQAQVAKQKSLIIDLSQIDFLSSPGFGLIIYAVRALKPHGRKVVLLRPQPFVDRTLRVTRLQDMLAIVESDEDAEQAARATGAASSA